MMRKELFALALLVSMMAAAQVQTPTWNTQLPGKVKWLQVNDWGVVITACSNGLFGLDPRDGKIIWKNESLTDIKESNYQSIESTPLVLVADKGSDAKTLIINGLTGAVIFDSNAEGYEKVVTKKILPELEGLLVAYRKDDANGIALYNYVTGDKIWSTSITKAKSTLIHPEPLLDTEQQILFANGKQLYRLDAAAGTILWSFETKKNIVDLFLAPSGNEVYVVSGSASEAFSGPLNESGMTVSGGTSKFRIDYLGLSDGSSTWKQPIEYAKSRYSGVALGEEDFFLMHTLGANQYAYGETRPMWKKEKMGTGGQSIAGLFESEQGMIYFSPDGAGRTYGFLVNKAGEQQWKKKAIIFGDLLALEDLGDAFFYITTRGLNFISKSDGKNAWSGDQYLSSNHPVDFIRQNENEYVVYVGGKLVRVDLQQQDWTLINGDFPFNEEVPGGLQQVEEGFVLTGNQNVVLIDGSGSVAYHTYYPVAEQSLGAKLALGTLSFAAATGSAFYGISSMAYGVAGALDNNEGYTKKANQQLSISSFSEGASSEFASLAEARFALSISAAEYKLILTTKDKAVGFVKVDLHDGQEKGTIITNDRTPMYVLDHVEDKFFLKSGDSEVSGYQL